MTEPQIFVTGILAIGSLLAAAVVFLGGGRR